MALNVTSEEIIIQIADNDVVVNATEEVIKVNLSTGGSDVITVTSAEEEINVEASDNITNITLSDTGLRGRPGIVWRDAWIETASYYEADVVSFNGSTYINTKFIEPSTTAFPDTTTGNWDLFSDRGEQGAIGAASTEVGPTGATGAQGATGDIGLTGLQGAKGADSIVVGPTGNPGAKGTQGDQGEQGLTGDAGTAGLNGETGATGDTGATGTTGAKGPQGSKGLDSEVAGPTGPAGVKGTTGDTGQRGLQGITGTVGPKGTTGSRGVQGFTGATGAASTIAGETGSTGATGAAGATGADGTDGATGAKGSLGPQGSSGATGPKGDTGESITGAKGTTGDTGAKGDQGDQGDLGATGSKGNTGDDGAAWYAGSTSPGDELGETGDFFLETDRLVVWKKSGFTWSEITEIKGVQGATGPAGIDGVEGPIGAVGDNGETGPQGPQGEDGNTTTWYSGNADPSLTVVNPNPNDFYFETDSKRFWEFKVVSGLTSPGGDWVEVASLPGQFADTPNRGNILGIDFDTSAGVVRGTVDATDISGGGGGGTSVGILDLPGSNATSINGQITLTNGRCFGPNDLGDDAFLDGLETDSECTIASTENAWNNLNADNSFLARDIGTHVVTQDEVDNGIRGLIQISILKLSDSADLEDTVFTIELGGAIQNFELPNHGGVIDIEFVQIPAILDEDGNEVTPARDQRPTSTGAHNFAISKASKSNPQDPGGVIRGSFSVLLNNEGGSVIIKPPVREILDELYDLTFNDTDNQERTLGVDFTRVIIDTDDDDDITRNRDIITATVNTTSLNLSVPGFEHTGTTGIQDTTAAEAEVNMVVYSGTTATTSSEGIKESTKIIIGANSVSGTVTTAPSFASINDKLANAVDVVYDGVGHYVAIRGTVSLSHSSDGVSWINSPYTGISPSSISSIYSVAYGNNQWVAAYKTTDDKNGALFSSNGTSWTNVSFASNNDIDDGGEGLDVTYLNGRFYYYGRTLGADRLASTFSGNTVPSVINQAEGSYIYDMDDDGNGLVIAAHWASGIITKSLNGAAFTRQEAIPGGNSLTSITYGNGLWVIGTENGKISTSPDGVTWTPRTSPTSARIVRGCYGGGLFILPTVDGDLLYSTNGTTWFEIDISGADVLVRAKVGKGKYFLMGTSASNNFYTSNHLGIVSTVTLTLPDHLATPLVFPLTSASQANSIASQIAVALNNATTTSLGMATATDNIVTFSSTVFGNEDIGAGIEFSGSNNLILSPALKFEITDGEGLAANVIKDGITVSNIDTDNGHTLSSLATSFDFNLTGNVFRDAIIGIFDSIGGYTANSGSSSAEDPVTGEITVTTFITFTSDTLGSESNILITYEPANDSNASVINTITIQGVEESEDGDLTSLIYTIQNTPYAVVFPSGVATANQQALFARSTITSIRSASSTDTTDFVMSVNGDLLNFRVPEGTIFTEHSVVLNPPSEINSPPYTGGTLIDSQNPVGTYVIPTIVSNVLSLTEFRDTISTSEYKGIDFTEDKSVVVGRVLYTWGDYTTSGLFQGLTSDTDGLTVKLQFSTTDDGNTPAFVYRRVLAAGTTEYSDTIYAEESLKTILATRGG